MWPPLTLRELIPRNARHARDDRILTLNYSDGRKVTYRADDLTHCLPTEISRGSASPDSFASMPDLRVSTPVLYASTQGLGCRGCLRLTYQSNCGSWDWPLANAVDKRLQSLAREPGPKGRRYRAWERRADRTALLTSLAAQPNVTFINGQGTLAPQTSSWHNELHPARAGFDTFADIFHQELKKLFPDRVA